MSMGRQRTGLIAVVTAVVLAAGAAVAVIGSDDGEGSPHQAAGQPSGPPERKPAKTQSPATWVDIELEPGPSARGWHISDPLEPARQEWYDVVAAHLAPAGELHRGPGGTFHWRLESGHGQQTRVGFGLLVDVADDEVLERACPLMAWSTTTERSGCRQQPFRTPDGHDAWIIRPRPPEPGSRYCGSPECADHAAMVLVERADGTLGWVMAFRHEAFGDPPYPIDLMAQAAADPRFTLPASASGVPRDSTVTAVAREHFENLQPDPESRLSTWGYGFTRGLVRATAWGRNTSAVDERLLAVAVHPAGRLPRCGRDGLDTCVARQVYGSEDPTTVYVGRWCDEFWCLTHLVYVGPRNTVWVGAGSRLSGLPRQQQQLIDLVLDPRLQ